EVIMTLSSDSHTARRKGDIEHQQRAPVQRGSTIAYPLRRMRQTSRTVSTAAALLVGGLSAACGLDWAVDEVSGTKDLRDAGGDSRLLHDGGLSGPPRACSRSTPCYFDEYCDYEDGKCGAGGDGVCKLRPNACTAGSPPQCGCDGRRYTMACEAHRAGIDDG